MILTKPQSIQSRIIDVGNEAGLYLNPIFLSNTPLLSFKESLHALGRFLPDLDSFIFLSLGFIDHLESIPFHLTKDEAAAIHIYTREWSERSHCLSYRLNQALRNIDRKEMEPYLGYLKLLLNGLSKMGSFNSPSLSLWRGVEDDSLGTISKSYKKGKKFFWWGFSSCTTNMDILNHFMGKDGFKKRVYFNIHITSHSIDIKDLSLYVTEYEILLLPARYFEVINQYEITPQILIIELQELQAPSMIKEIIEIPTLSINSPHNQQLVQLQQEHLMQQTAIENLLSTAEKVYQCNNFKVAFELFSSLTEVDKTGHSFFRLGKMYKFGIGVEKDNIKKQIYLEKALPLLRSKNNALVWTDLGELYATGEAVPTDLNEAIRYFKLSSDQGYAPGQYYMAKMYQKGKGCQLDLNEAFRYFKLSSDQGNPASQNYLAKMYQKGKGCQVDLNEAFKYFKKSADQGNASSQNHLAKMYENGKCQYDLNESFRYFKLSADQGNSVGQYYLAKMYHKGKGCQHDWNEAFRYYKLSADQGNSDAKKKLDSFKMKKAIRKLY